MLIFVLQIGSYYEIGEGLVPSVGLAKRIGTETYKFVETKPQLQQAQLYHLIYRTQIQVSSIVPPS